MKKYKLSTIQHCPIHSCDIVMSRIDEITGAMIFNCKNNKNCIWVKDHEHELRHKFNNIKRLQKIIDAICALFPDTKEKKSILLSLRDLADYI